MLRRRSVARLLSIVLLLVTPLLAAPVKLLQDRVAGVLSGPELASGFWGIEVVSLSTGKTLYSQNANKLFTPASNTKLFTTAAALALIGADYQFRTTVETTGTLDRYGRLNGDLVLVGRGDPNLSGRELPYDLRTQRNDDPIQALESLADALVQKGVKFIDDDIVADDSYFAFERYGEGWSQDDLVWADGAPVSALTINDNVVFVNILPADRPGEKAFVSVKPFAEYYRIDNKVSQNLHAEILLRLLGRERGTAGTIEGGLEVLRGFLTQAGIPNDQYVFYDGSGLSRQNLVTPHAIVELLRYNSTQPWGAAYQATFPVPGVRGSLSERLNP